MSVRAGARSVAKTLAVIVVVLGLASCRQGDGGAVGGEDRDSRGLPEQRSLSPDDRAGGKRTGAVRREAVRSSSSLTEAGGRNESTDADIASGREIRGRVLLGDTRTLAAGAQVWAASAEGESAPLALTAADQDGAYRLLVPDSTTSVILYASSPGYGVTGVIVPETDSSARHTGSPRLTLDLELQRASFVRGKVLDAAGLPLAGALVQASRLSFPANAPTSPDVRGAISVQTWETLSGEAGEFGMEEIPAGELTMEVSRAGWVPVKKQVESPAESLVFQLGREGFGVDGHVFYRATGGGVKGATIRLTEMGANGIPLGEQRSWTTASDELGGFSISGLSEGIYRISGHKDDLVVRSRDPIAGNQVKLSAGETTRELTLLLDHSHTVTGRVTDKQDGSPVEGVEVTAPGQPGKLVRTGADGTYLLAGVEPGPHGSWAALRFTKKGYVLETVDDLEGLELVQLGGEQSEARKDVRLIRVVTVSGRVVTESGAGIPGAVVDIAESGKGVLAETDGSGLYELEVRARSSVRVRARADGYGIGHSEMSWVDSESTSGIDIVLSPGGRIRGVVVNADGEPGKNVWVTAFVQGAGERGPGGVLVDRQLSDGSGRFAIDNLPGKEVALFADGVASWLRSAPMQVDLSHGQTRDDIRLVLRRLRIVSGVVVDSEGQPTAGAHLTASPDDAADNIGASAISDAQGRFTLSGIATDTVRVTVTASGYENLTESVETGDGPLRLVLQKRKTLLLIGSVFDVATSAPVTRFEVLVGGKYPLQPGEGGNGMEYRNDGSGVFSISNYPFGASYQYHYVVRAPGYRDHDTGVRQTIPRADPGSVDRGVLELLFPLERDPG